MGLITHENIRSFAYVNDRIVKHPIRGIALKFFGLNGRDMYAEETPSGEFYAAHGILYVVPYNNPWAWMNRQAVDYTDELLDVLIEKYHLPESIPIASTGGSMGGMSALVYTRYAKRTPAVCVANCPVCDMPYHYTERPDLPRTLYSAFFREIRETGDVDTVLKAVSPLHIASEMPDIPYFLFHCDADKAVNKEKHSDRFVAAMRECGKTLTYHVIPGRGHCDIGDDMKALFRDYVVQALTINK
ncbi:MAG: prolyl oligopeptidase family serine peptidase [Clostridia bacterium]|nr:prolyl oligopeptidase family serine peptidase [Clostridia bacterium]